MIAGRALVALGAGIALSALLATEALAAPFTVTRLDDPVPGACAPGDCSLREAIRAANLAPGEDSIALDAGTYQLSQVGTDEDAALDGDLDILDDLTLTGAGVDESTIDGGGSVTGERVLQLDPLSGGAAPVISLSGLTITDGAGSFGAGILGENESVSTLTDVSVSGNDGDSFGGGIFNQNDSVMTIRDSVISDNSLTGSFASGVMNQNDAVLTIARTTIAGNATAGTFAGAVMNQNNGRMTIRDSAISENSVAGRGAGLFLQNESITEIQQTTISDNRSSASVASTEVGAGLAIQNDADVTLTNVTVSGNRADDQGGGIHLQNAPVVRLRSSTVSDNTADADGDGGGLEVGGGIFVDAGSLTLANSLLAENADSAAPDCSGAVASAGFNLVGDATGCGFAAVAGDQVGSALAPIDPRLKSLADNGGPTFTHALLGSSPAIDAGNRAAVAVGAGGCPSGDQRGAPRKKKRCDIGAYERVKCAGTLVNHVGTSGRDKLKGSGRKDGFLGLGGNDTLNGKGGKDGICGGDGNDNLKGGGANDKLRGEKGRDKLDCGPGRRDSGRGGPGKDKLKRCERR